MNAYDEELLTPVSVHGWWRRSCQNLWGGVAVLWLLSLVAAVVWQGWASWALCAVLAAAWVFTMAVGQSDPRVEDRRVLWDTLIMTVSVIVLVACAWGLALLIVGVR